MPRVVKYVGRILEFRLDEAGQKSVLVEGHVNALPDPGQFMILEEIAPAVEEAFGWSVFPAEITERGFFTPLPPHAAWTLDTGLQIRGPLGNGFRIPSGLRNLAIAGFSPTLHRIRPLIDTALREGTDIALFVEGARPGIPPEIEIQPLASLSRAFSWADYLAIDLEISDLPAFRARAGLEPDQILPAGIQVLVDTPMPCAGIAECGVCAVRTRRGKYKLACKEGPVFQLNEVNYP